MNGNKKKKKIIRMCVSLNSFIWNLEVSEIGLYMIIVYIIYGEHMHIYTLYHMCLKNTVLFKDWISYYTTL